MSAIWRVHGWLPGSLRLTLDPQCLVSMILYMWPIILVLVLPVICATAELASAYPVAGAMSSWTWIMAKRGIGGERYWGWLMGGIVLGYHVTTVGPGLVGMRD